MDTINLLLIGLLVAWGLCFYQANRYVWLVVLLLTMAAVELAGYMGLYSRMVCWGLLLVLGMGVLSHRIRILLFTTPLYRLFTKLLPPMSETEREAIESGDVWWEAEIFQGAPNWENLFNLPKPKLKPDEQAFIDNQVEVLCSLLDDWAITHEKLDLPANVWDYLKKERFFSLLIPKSYGGHEFSALANSTIVQKIATRSLTAAVTVMVPNSLGPAELLLHYGTDEQKEAYLPKLARGEDIPCFALTAPEAGSDAGAIPDTGVVCYGEFNGQQVLGLRLDWNKRYITLAPIATVLGLAVKVVDPEHLLGKKSHLGITVCLLPTNLPGVEIGARHFPLNQAFMNGPTRGRGVFVPLDFVIGGRAMIGRGWKMLVECLAAGRGISLPALSTASGKLCFRTTGAYATIRQQFGISIGKFEGVADAMAHIGGYTYMLEAMRLLTTTAIDQNKKPAVVTAIAKYHMTEMGRAALNHAMDVHAGRGIILGHRNYLARAYQGAPISITVEGANILTRSLIIFGQGAIRCHPFLKDEIELAQLEKIDPNTMKQFDKLILSHGQYVISNFARLLAYSLTAGKFIKSPKKGVLKPYLKQINRMSLALSVVSEVSLLLLGGSLKRRECLSARLGDVLSYLYMASCVVKYFCDRGGRKADVPFLKWSLETCLYQSQQAFLGVFQNYPITLLGGLLKRFVFPFGAPYQPPSDRWIQPICQVMMKLSSLRDELSSHCYINNSQDDILGRLECALLASEQAAGVLAKLTQSVKQGIIPKQADMALKIRIAQEENILNEKEISLLREYEALRTDVIEVDEFLPDQLVGKK